jgi:organic radical activating enzyme
VICTGGEPTLQIDVALVSALHEHGFEVAVETNGTKPVIPTIDWICVSPKAGAPLKQTRGSELKVVYPQPALDLDNLLALDFQHFFLQPMDGPDVARNTRDAIEHCLADPRWRLSVQSHKILGIP